MSNDKTSDLMNDVILRLREGDHRSNCVHWKPWSKPESCDCGLAELLGRCADVLKSPFDCVPDVVLTRVSPETEQMIEDMEHEEL